MCSGSEVTPGGVELEVWARPCPILYSDTNPVTHAIKVYNRSSNPLGQFEVFVDITHHMLDLVVPAGQSNSLPTQIGPRKVMHYRLLKAGEVLPTKNCLLKRALAAIRQPAEEISTIMTFSLSDRGQKNTLTATYHIPVN